MKVTNTKLIRWAGLSAVIAGIIFTAIQPTHPSINTSAFIIITSLKTSISIFGLLGITGLYARQVEETGWKGLAGYLLLTIYYAVQMCISFIEPTVLPLLTTTAPTFVESMLQLSSGTGVPMNLGSLTNVYSLVSILYVLGSMLFGMAMFRVRILPRGAAALFAVSGPLAGTMFTLLPYHLVQLTSIPIGAAMVWLGYALFSERREKKSASLLDQGIVSQVA
ncbi:MAG TPA: hypothetical protein PLT08_00090 [Anaerolineales bacterium]|nr:hypothetical protein [Anaerolineales bacterium]